MGQIASVNVKRSAKQERELKVLIGLVDYYLKTGKPVGSNTLKEAGFEDLSSATLRNYFANLEEEGYLRQLHSSGGREPTSKALRLFAKSCQDELKELSFEKSAFQKLRQTEMDGVVTLLQEGLETLSVKTNCPAFLSSPRFDQDFVSHLKLVDLDASRCISVIVTHFGSVHTEVVPLEKKLSSLSVKRINSYFQWRLTGRQMPSTIELEEEALAKSLYNETMVRYLVGSAHSVEEEIYRTGCSKLLSYPDFSEPKKLTGALGLFENGQSMRLLLRECAKQNRLRYWIDDDLAQFSNEAPNCSVVLVPYRVNCQTVGALGVLGPLRMPYRDVFMCLQDFSTALSEALTKSVYRFKISYREPFLSGYSALRGDAKTLLIENKSAKETKNNG